MMQKIIIIIIHKKIKKTPKELIKDIVHFRSVLCTDEKEASTTV